MSDFFNDLRYAFRGLRKSPGFTAVAVATLALGIGANTAIFTLLDAVAIKSLPVRHPEELFTLNRVAPDEESPRFSYPAFSRLRNAAPAHARFAAVTPTIRLMASSGGRDSEPAVAQLVSGEYFDVLGVRAIAGRLLSPQDERAGAKAPTAVVSSGYWKRRFASDPSVIGRTLSVGSVPVTIVGVAEPSFFGASVGEAPDVWLPLTLQHEIHYAGNSDYHNADSKKAWGPQENIQWLMLMVRVQPVGKLPGVASRLTALFNSEISREIELWGKGQERERLLAQRLVVHPARRGFDDFRQRFTRPLSVLMAIVVLVLAIACANLANLLLVRGAGREREMAIRLSVGASRAQILSPLLIESLLLAAAGGAAGLLVAKWGCAGLVRLASSGAQPLPLDLSPDLRVLLFALAATLSTGMLFGLAPAIRSTRVDPAAALHGAGRGTSSFAGKSIGKLLVAGQTALCLLLLVGAGLFARTLRNLTATDPGYDGTHVLTARISPRLGGYALAELPGLYDRVLAAVRGLPGVRSASVSLGGLALGNVSTSGMLVAGGRLPPGRYAETQVDIVSAGFFESTAMPIVRGRALLAEDVAGRRSVAVVNESFARQNFATPDAVGRSCGFDTDHDFEIVGVVRDARVNGLRESPSPMLYLNVAQNNEYESSIEVRVDGDTRPLTQVLRRKILEVEPRLPLFEISTVADNLGRSVQRERLIAWLAGAFAVLALLLAALGLYGVMSRLVARRTSELGIRAALGANRRRLLGLVLSESLTTVGLGLAAGIPLLLAASRGVASLLYGLAPTDGATIVAAALVFLAAALAASYPPARRAARIDPMTALRQE
jgi:predicted permease